MFVHRVDAHFHGQVIKIDIAGLDDGLVQIHPAVAAFLPVAVFVILAGQLEVGAGEHRPFGGVDAFLQAGQAVEGFEGGARRILAAQRPVEQRAVIVVAQTAVGRRVDAVDEQIGIEPRFADHGEDVAVARIQGHHGAVVVFEGVHGDPLQAAVDAEIQGLTGRGGHVFDDPYDSALGIDLHPL